MNDKIDDEDHDEFSWEDFAEDREKKTGFLTLKPDKDSFYPAFIACAFMYFLSLLYWYSDVGQYLWVSYRDIFIEQEYWRIVTSVFIHADIKHFLANVPLFFIFAWWLYQYYGAVVFPFCSFVLGFLNQVIVLYLYGPGIRILGASGMLYGMIALWVVWYIRYDVDHSLKIRYVRAVGFLLVMLVPSTFYPQVSYLAHGIGFLLGVIFALVLLPVTDNLVEKKIQAVKTNTFH